MVTLAAPYLIAITLSRPLAPYNATTIPFSRCSSHLLLLRLSRRLFWAVSDTAAHGMTAAVNWVVAALLASATATAGMAPPLLPQTVAVSVRAGRLPSWLWQAVLCGVAAALLDLDHFAAAGSLQLGVRSRLGR